MFKENINKIDNQLKKIFTNVEYNTDDHRKVSITAFSPLNENVNNNLKMEMEVSTKNLTELDPVISYSYYTNPNSKDNKIGFDTKIGKMGEVLSSVVENNRFNTEYLDSLIEE